MSNLHTVKDVISLLKKEGEEWPYIVSVLESMIDDHIKGYTANIQTSIDSFFPAEDVRSINCNKLNRVQSKRAAIDRTFLKK
jgi:hypothetical protein